jgi:predicted amidohydrolase
VAALQFVSEFGDPARNRAGLAVLTRQAARNGAQIVVMPETAVPGYMSANHQVTWRDPVRRPNPGDGWSLVEAGVAEMVPGESTRFFGELAKELGIHVVVAIVEKVAVQASAAGRPRTDYYNTAVLLAPDGRIACHYRKLNLWMPGDGTWAQEGNLGLGLCDTEFGKLGLMICFDQTCGVAPRLKAAGARTILYPIAWVHDGPPEAWFDLHLPERVKAWDVNLVGANWSLAQAPAGPKAVYGYGCSRIIARDGAILARAGPAGNDILYADLPREGASRR